MEVKEEPKIQVVWNVTKFGRQTVADVSEDAISASASVSPRRDATLTWLLYCTEENIRCFLNVGLCEKTWILSNAAVNLTSCTRKFVAVHVIKAQGEVKL